MQPELKPVRTNDSRFGSGSPYAAGAGVAISPEAQKVLRNTYLLLAADHGADGDRRLHRHGDRRRHHGQPDHQHPDHARRR